MNVQNLIICDTKVIFNILIEIKENLNCNILFKTKHEISKINNLENYLILSKKKIKPCSVNELQKLVWKQSTNLETHTVETHIYRLRKKIKDKFNDDNFIMSLKEGYKIN